jgi:hypothetical protein
VGAWSASPSGQSDAGKSYVVFGKTNSSAINLSVIAELYQIQHKIYLYQIDHYPKHPQSNHPSHRR